MKELTKEERKEIKASIKGLTKKDQILMIIQDYKIKDAEQIAELTGFTTKLVKDYVWIMNNRQGLKVKLA